MFAAYFHRTVRSSIAFIIGSILERSRVRYYHPALIGELMTRALYTALRCSNSNKEEHTVSNIPRPGPASTIQTQLYQPYKDLHHPAITFQAAKKFTSRISALLVVALVWYVLPIREQDFTKTAFNRK